MGATEKVKLDFHKPNKCNFSDKKILKMLDALQKQFNRFFISKPYVKCSILINNLNIKGVNLMVSGFEGQRAEASEDIVAVALVNGVEVEKPVQTGTIEWSSSNPEVLEVLENPENEKRFSCRILEGLTQIETAQVIASGDADLGEGVVTITAPVLTVECKPLQATAFREAVVTPFHD